MSGAKKFDANGVKQPETVQFRLAQRVQWQLAHAEGLLCLQLHLPLEIAPICVAFPLNLLRAMAIQDLQTIMNQQVMPGQAQQAAKLIDPSLGTT